MRKIPQPNTIYRQMPHTRNSGYTENSAAPFTILVVTIVTVVTGVTGGTPVTGVTLPHTLQPYHHNNYYD